MRGHAWNAIGVVFSPDGQFLYSVSWDGTIRRWDTATWKEEPIVAGAATGMITCSTVEPVVAWEGSGGIIHLSDMATGKKLRTLSGNPAGLSHLAFSPDGSVLAAGGNDLSVQLWEVTCGKLLRQWSWPKGTDPHTCVDDIGFAPDGKTLATAGFRTNDISLWNAQTGAPIRHTTHKMGFGVVFLPDGQSVVSAGWDQSIRWWKLPDLRQLDAITLPMPDRKQRVQGSSDTRLHAIACSPDGYVLATVDLAGMVSLWDSMKRKQLHTFPAASSQCNLAISPDGQWLTAGSWKGDMSLWDVRTGQRVLSLPGHPARVFRVSFGSDGRTLATGSADNTGLLWDLRPLPEPNDNLTTPALWDALAGKDAAAAYRAIWHLADRPQESIPFLKGKLTPAKAIDRARVTQLVKQLNSNKFPEREAASKELSSYGESIEPEIRLELAQAASPEACHRLQALLDALPALGTIEDARQARAVVVLKWTNTQEARQLLKDLSQGLATARLTQQANAALRHLESRVP